MKFTEEIAARATTEKLRFIAAICHLVLFIELNLTHEEDNDKKNVEWLKSLKLLKTRLIRRIFVTQIYTVHLFCLRKSDVAWHCINCSSPNTSTCSKVKIFNSLKISWASWNVSSFTVNMLTMPTLYHQETEERTIKAAQIVFKHAHRSSFHSINKGQAQTMTKMLPRMSGHSWCWNLHVVDYHTNKVVNAVEINFFWLQLFK